MSEVILRLPATQGRAGIKRSAIYDRMRAGTWPRQIKLGPRAVGWRESEVDAVIRATIAGKTDDEIRELVKTLEAARKHAADGIKVAP